MDDPRDSNAVIPRDIEDQIIANRIKTQIGREVIASLARVRMCCQHFAGFIDLIELPVCGDEIVSGDVGPYLYKVDFGSRTASDLRH